MPDVDIPIPPYTPEGAGGHDDVHETVRLALIAIDEAIAGIPNIIVSTTEPTHDGSQVDGDIWIKKV